MTRQRIAWLVAMLVPALISSGCGGGGADRPPMGQVSGTVTKDGKPVSPITVIMRPEVGRPAIGVTNDKGHYEMEYARNEKGTRIGPNSVSLEWPTGLAPPFRIPRRYAAGNKAPKLDVKPGNQTYDIAIEPDPKKPTDDKDQEKKPGIAD